MKNQDFFTVQEASNLLDISIPRLQAMIRKGVLSPVEETHEGFLLSRMQLMSFEVADWVFSNKWDEQIKIRPKRKYKSIELFAGAGGMAIGLERAGFSNVLLNEIDKYACGTLRMNRPSWNVLEGTITDVDFKSYEGKIDLLTGGFPCQAFSSAGKKLGFNDTRGTLFFEFARSIDEVKPKVFMGENVKGLFNHDGGKTLETIKNVIDELGYFLVEPRVLKAMYYKVPQKRERLLLVGIRKDLVSRIESFKFPEPFHRVLTVRDAFAKGDLFDTDVPESQGDSYNEKKRCVMDLVPEGGYWKHLPDDVQRDYMGGSYYLGGGKTGLARRLSMDAPSLTLVCAAAMKQTERCHPTETRPLTVRESARIQTFPDDWEFFGSKLQAYKQIGNAVPVNLAYAMGLRLIDLLNEINEEPMN